MRRPMAALLLMSLILPAQAELPRAALKRIRRVRDTRFSARSRSGWRATAATRPHRPAALGDGQVTFVIRFALR